MWKRAAVVAVALLVAIGVWAGFREMRQEECFFGDAGQAVDAYKGLTLAEAEARAERDGLVVRVLGRDGECFDRTSDLRPDRVDLYIEDGEVVEARQPQAGTT